jgi:hypothetical protein|tara:strand:+ start:989 stop:1462 length:474 start_codon:yes stop_codon:yes gene_type:complete
MITGVYGSTISSYLTLEEKRIHTAVDASKVRYLFKFTNDLTKTVKYAYGVKSTTNDRYVKNTFAHNATENIFTGAINFKPYGFWSYEVYEVTFIGTVGLNDTNAPNSETEILSVHNDNGVVKGKVEEGKLYIQETAGSEQIKYTQHTTTETNYLHTN